MYQMCNWCEIASEAECQNCEDQHAAVHERNKQQYRTQTARNWAMAMRILAIVAMFIWLITTCGG